MLRITPLLMFGMLLAGGTANAQFHDYDRYSSPSDYRYDSRYQDSRYRDSSSDFHNSYHSGSSTNRYRSNSPSQYSPSYHPSPSYPSTRYPSTSYPSTTYPSPIYRDSYDGHAHDHATPRRPVAQPVYGDFRHVDDLATQLEQQANDLCLEMHYNYQHNPGYRETYGESYKILTTAKSIHEMVHAGDRNRVRRAVTQLDSLFHHVQDDVRNWSRHSHRNLGGDLRTKMALVEDTLHHLMSDVGTSRR